MKELFLAEFKTNSLVPSFEEEIRTYGDVWAEMCRKIKPVLAIIPYKLHRFKANMVFTNLKNHDLLKIVVFDCTVLSAALVDVDKESIQSILLSNDTKCGYTVHRVFITVCCLF